ncbi:YceI family protein [Janthinobacterium fluminis]|uniref:YceI family protein n=1 Tax=Janthinobacterium fluminis TaxID=2987524 RepID=A0ABT5JUG2_9BURK|nr:YceI family protein [Janthinobacterium fluminis]MDC8756397.1 YceI family protein [Janthinobacterium fluminis]
MPIRTTPRRLIAPIALACLLGACAPAPRVPPAAPAAPAAADDFGQAYYARLQAGGQTVLRIDPQASLIGVTVRRGGVLARMGHDHIVASRGVAGFVAPALGRADFHFRLDQLSVDEAGLRQEAGLDSKPSPADIEGTRNNMLTRVLDAAHFPDVLVHAERTAADAPLRVSITLHGVTRTLDIPVAIEAGADGRGLVASGSVALKQSDFGLVPFAVFGGALAVQDRMELRFRLVSR